MASAGDFTARRTTVGQYVITLPSGFRLSNAVASAAAAGGMWTQVASPSDRTFAVLGFNSANAAADTSFSFVAVGAGA